jgi:hypothetical protein
VSPRLASAPHTSTLSRTATASPTSPEITRASHRSPAAMGDAASGRGRVVSPPRTAEDIFKDYRARRSAILRALTHGQ